LHTNGRLAVGEAHAHGPLSKQPPAHPRCSAFGLRSDPVANANIPLRVLIVEDSADDAALLARKRGYECAWDRVDTAQAMWASLRAKTRDIIFSDYMIPDVGGMEALKVAQDSGLALPFIVVSGKFDEEALVEVMKAGASDFLVKGRLGRLGAVACARRRSSGGRPSTRCAMPIRLEGRVFGVLTGVYSHSPAAFIDDEVKLLNEMAGDIGYGIATRRTPTAYEAGVKERAQQALKLRATFESAIAALVATVEQREPYTAGHQRRVAELAVAIGRELGLDEERPESLRIASTIHDIGKIYVPAEILSRPGRLSAVEFEIVKSHAQVDYDIVKGVDFPWPVAETILQHHERLDGSGYPQGLKSGQIILEVRILAVANVIEAMSSQRPYWPELGLEVALEQVQKDAGENLDSAVVTACVRLFKEKGLELPRTQ